MSDITNGFDKFLGSAGGALKLANGVTGLVDGIFGISAKRQENAQKRLMDKQQDQWKEQQGILNDYMLEQWNRENEYNDPTNYYKRLLQGADANGISKAGVLGDMPGGMVGQSASKNTPGGNTGTGVGSPSALGLGESSSLAGLRQRAEIANLESQTEANLAQAGLNREKTGTESVHRGYLSSLQNYYLAAENLVKEQALSEPAKRALDRINAICKQTENRIMEFNHALNRTFSFKEREMGLSKSYQDINESLSRVDLNTTAGLHYKASIGLMKLQGALFESQSGYFNSMTNLNDIAYKYESATFTDRIIWATERALQEQERTSILGKEDNLFYAKFAFESLESLMSSIYNVASIFQRAESTKVQKASVQNSYERGQEDKRRNEAVENMLLRLVMSQLGK